MIKRVVTLFVVVPLAIVLVALAVANRAPTAFTIDPFNPGNPALTATMPLFVYLFIALILGLVIGSTATWLRQGRYRKLARRQTGEAEARRDLATPADSKTTPPVPAVPVL